MERSSGRYTAKHRMDVVDPVLAEVGMLDVSHYLPSVMDSLAPGNVVGEQMHPVIVRQLYHLLVNRNLNQLHAEMIHTLSGVRHEVPIKDVARQLPVLLDTHGIDLVGLSEKRHVALRSEVSDVFADTVRPEKVIDMGLEMSGTLKLQEP